MHQQSQTTVPQVMD